MKVMDVVVTNKIGLLILNLGQKLVSQIISSFFIQPPPHHSPCFYSIPILSIKFVALFLISSFIFTMTNPSKGWP